MEMLNFQFFVLTIALVGVVIIIAALLSGFIDRSDLPPGRSLPGARRDARPGGIGVARYYSGLADSSRGGYSELGSGAIHGRRQSQHRRSLTP
jgi:hypothetical protein